MVQLLLIHKVVEFTSSFVRAHNLGLSKMDHMSIAFFRIIAADNCRYGGLSDDCMLSDSFDQAF